jgi:hypothetical protein
MQHRTESDHEPLHVAERAADNLRFIRSAMERSSRFTDISGLGMVLIGVSALAATVIASRQASPLARATTWEIEAALAIAIGLLAALWKAHGATSLLLSAPTRKFALGFIPALVAGAVLTLVLERDGLFALLPGMWLVVYGAAVANAGAFSVRLIPAIGLSFMAVGVVTFLAPPAWSNWLLGLGFGGLHIAFGAVIARRYGG